MCEKGQEVKAATDREVDLAVRRYDILFRHIATEETLTWTGCQLYVVANSALLTFCAARFPKDTHWLSLVPPLIISVVGLILSLFWRGFMQRAPGRADRWLVICRQLEQMAFGETNVIRGARERKIHSMSYVVIVFLSIWVISILGLAVALGFGFAQANSVSTRADGRASSASAPAVSSAPASPQPSASPTSH
jgi:hypothetical protein